MSTDYLDDKAEKDLEKFLHHDKRYAELLPNAPTQVLLNTYRRLSQWIEHGRISPKCKDKLQAAMLQSRLMVLIDRQAKEI